MEKNSPIGFFDSGVGGLSVYARFKEILPNEDTIYFGDLKNLPYGNKSQKELIGFAKNILDFFESKNVKAVVIACNTSSALAYDYVKDDYNFKIYPIIQSCAKVLASMDISKLGIFATQATIGSGAYEKEIYKYNPALKIKGVACPNWVSIVEGVLEDNDDIKSHMTEMMEFNPDKIVLGCTHYPYLLNELTKYASREIFIDPAQIFVEYIKSTLELNPEGSGKEEFYVSAMPEEFIKNAKLFYDVKTLPQVIEPATAFSC